MAIRKTGKTYQIDYYDPNGKRIRKHFKKKKDAVAELGKRESLMVEGRYLDVKEECTTDLGKLIDVYKDNHQAQPNFRMKKIYLENFKQYFGEDRILSKIRYVDVETYRNHLRQKLTPNRKIRSVASVNREMSCLRHLFRKGFEWEMIYENPFTRGQSLLLKENNQRLRFLTEDEIDSLLDACSTSVIEFPNSKTQVKKTTRKDIHYIRDIVECALNTGMRKGELLSLMWSQVRNGFIYLAKTKTSNPRQIPINDDLAELFKRIKKRQIVGSKHVFMFQRKRIDDTKMGFIAAVKRAGIEDFKFHDLRHTFASQLVMRGGSLKDIQELLGHKTIAMTMRYAHLSEPHKKKNLGHKMVTFLKS